MLGGIVQRFYHSCAGEQESTLTEVPYPSFCYTKAMKGDQVVYRHTQIGRLMIATMIVVAAMFGVLIVSAGVNDPNVTPIMLLILVIMASFSTLTVTIDKTHVKIQFGYGIYRKKFPLNTIVSAQAVRNHWYYGWGIRFWFWPRMWIFNVSGFDAVELRFSDGKRIRIGTDAPKELERALQSQIGSR